MTRKTADNTFANGQDLAVQLAGDVATRLKKAIADNGRATLAVSGGSTPKLFFGELSKSDIAWENVTIILVDERFVAPDSSRSNERLVRDNLMVGSAAKANLIGFWSEGKDIDQAEQIAADKIAASSLPINVAILGMGLDGHTASFFPGGSNLKDAMDRNNPNNVIQMEAEGAGEPRLTLTLPLIVKSDYVVLHIEGQAKHDVLKEALSDNTSNAPIRTVIDELNSPINLYWAP